MRIAECGMRNERCNPTPHSEFRIPHSFTAVARFRRSKLQYAFRTVRSQRSVPVFVAASTECFLDLSLPAALDRLADLEFTSVELALFEDADHLRPSQVLADVERAAALCRNARRLDVVAL